MGFRISDIAASLGAEAAGDTSLSVTGAAEPQSARGTDLAIALSPAYADQIGQGAAKAALLWPGADWQGLGLSAAIFAPRGRLAMARLTQMLDPGPTMSEGIHPTAQIDPTATIGKNPRIGPFCVIGAGAVLGDAAWIGSHVSIGAGSTIGDMAMILDGVRIARNVRIGSNVILQPNVVLGGDGFSFVTETASHVEVARSTLGAGEVPTGQDPTWHRIHSLGGVEIGDDVEIGAGSTVDAGTIRATRIGSGTKIDNLVQVGHNVIVGEHCLLCAQAGVAGSARVGDRVVIGGKAGVADNITVGDDVVLSGGTIALSNVPAGRVMMGYPAVRMETHIESYKALRRLPRILRDLAKGQKPVSKPPRSD
ncbi:UDP-3-O-(3-hydroxymyristoyl)glucosamine N-acyltransferase [Flavimaricola marinus]|uniref:UDP-3-O-acylglucosamine N-acyltransferase n=1 Tax=Flavimaricola marinus TaxID=1819565 RepID=A0A238LD51_9RHOB|nr:UDP-3-O-(3-hydroxymyristoyl)glucosamine N-acyltransferase [Flavimaricola marinus]SMY07512.1 UDP-3-O-acylglucosamine N-acyltransferase [Flavimaricola marinus]